MTLLGLARTLRFLKLRNHTVREEIVSIVLQERKGKTRRSLQDHIVITTVRAITGLIHRILIRLIHDITHQIASIHTTLTAGPGQDHMILTAVIQMILTMTDGHVLARTAGIVLGHIQGVTVVGLTPGLTLDLTHDLVHAVDQGPTDEAVHVIDIGVR